MSRRRRAEDFPRLLRSLDAEGVSPAQVAREIGVARSTISRIKTGDRAPGYEVGTGIVEMFCRHVALRQHKRG